MFSAFRNLIVQDPQNTKRQHGIKIVFYFRCLCVNTASVAPERSEQGFHFNQPLLFAPGPSADCEHASHVAMTTDRFDWQIRGSF